MRRLFLILLLCAPVVLASPTRPSTRPATTQSVEEQKRRQTTALTRQALELFKQKKYDQVEEVLKQALRIDPSHVTSVYNMACVLAVTNRPDMAMTWLERAADMGFTDFTHITRDSDLEPLRNLPRYKAFIAKKDEYQKRDAEKALASLKKVFGEKYLYDMDTTHKLIFATNTDKGTLTAMKDWLTSQAASLTDQLFSHKPDAYVTVVLPADADYRKMVRMRGVEGFYNDELKMLVARRLGQILTHEFTHALHAADQANVGQDHPTWITEGLASLYEPGVFEKSQLIPRDNFRLRFLQISQRNNKLIPLEKLVKMPQEKFVASPTLSYGQSSSVMLYLYDKGLLRKFYDAYKATFDKDSTGQLALETVSGQKLKDFELEWKKWMMKRTPPAMVSAPGGVYMGVRMAQESDGIKVTEVVADGPAAAAGMKVGDFIVGFEDADVRDQNTLMPLLVNFKPGDVVKFKVRRGGEYLDMEMTLGKRPE